ncbi:MAG: glycosyltransferase 61 family protein [Nocardioidaceae bacterium]
MNLIDAARRPFRRRGTSLVDVVADSLTRSSPSLALVVDGDAEDIRQRFVARLPQARIVVVPGELAADERHVLMAARGRFDAIVAATRPERATEVFKQTFFHLRQGGSYVCHVPTGPPHELLEFLDRLAIVRRGEAVDETADVVAIARAAGEARLASQAVLVPLRGGSGWAKLRDIETNRWLSLAPDGRGDVIATLPAVSFDSRCELRQSESEESHRHRDRFDVPELNLRRYDNVVCAPGQVVVQQNVLLPDTYRHNDRARLRNSFTRDLEMRFARPKAALGNPEPLPGEFFHLDSEFRGHFGHMITEQLSRLWAYQRAKQEAPGLKALLFTNRRPELLDYERRFYQAAGVPADDLVLVGGPARVDRLYAASPMFVQPAFAHPDISAVWSSLAEGILPLATDRTLPKRFFCARRNDKRACTNAGEVEAFFAERGFAIVYPEDYSLGDQARLFRGAELIAGWAGSALFNLIYADEPKRVVMVSSEYYTAKNEYVISSVLGHRLSIAWCRPDLAAAGEVRKRLQTPFRFDARREGVWLADELADS